MDELEDISQCDLPLLTSKPKRSLKKQQSSNDVVFHSPEDFAFGFEAGEMCVADEVFFQGQILPLHPILSKKSTRSDSTEANGFNSTVISTSRGAEWPDSGSGKAKPVMITRVNSNLSSRVDSTDLTRLSLSRDLVRCGSMDRYASSESEFKSMDSSRRITTCPEPGAGVGKPVKITRVRSDPSSYSSSTNLTQLNSTRNLTRSGSMDRVPSRNTVHPKTGLDKQLNLSQKLIRPGITDPNLLTGLKSPYTTRSDSRSTTRVSSESRTRTRNQFHTHPSPKPHVRASSASYNRENNSSNARLERARSVKTKQKSSVWDFFRLGLVRTPEIEIQEIRANILRRSSSCRIPSKAGAPASEGSANSGDEWKKTTFLSGSCKCSAVDSNAIVASKSKPSDDRSNIEARSEKVRLLTEATNGVILSDWSERRKEQTESFCDREGRRRKPQPALNRRTCEWLKQLSHGKAVAMHV